MYVRKNLDPIKVLRNVIVEGLNGEEAYYGILSPILEAQKPFFGIRIIADSEAERLKLERFGISPKPFIEGFKRDEDNSDKPVLFWFFTARKSTNVAGEGLVKVFGPNRDELDDEGIKEMLGNGSICDIAFTCRPATDTSKGISTLFTLAKIMVKVPRPPSNEVDVFDMEDEDEDE